jgi:hypothetical protein
MKTTRLLITTAMLAACVPLGAARAAVILDDAAVHGTNPPYLTLTRSIPSGQGLFAVRIDLVRPNIPYWPEVRFSGWSIAEYYALYTVSPGTHFDAAYALTHEGIVDERVSRTSVLYIEPGESQFFGYWDDRNFNRLRDSNDNYGWVQLYYEFDVAPIMLVAGGATAIGGGIIVGTTTQIPEPSPAWLLACGLAGVALVRRRR